MFGNLILERLVLFVVETTELNIGLHSNHRDPNLKRVHVEMSGSAYGFAHSKENCYVGSKTEADNLFAHLG